MTAKAMWWNVIQPSTVRRHALDPESQPEYAVGRFKTSPSTNS